jgi:hypothetical protein
MSHAWNVSNAKRTIKKSALAFPDPIHPKGSSAISEGREIVRIITEDQLFADEDALGSLVIYDTQTMPSRNILKLALALGDLGIINNFFVPKFKAETSGKISWGQPVQKVPIGTSSVRTVRLPASA